MADLARALIAPAAQQVLSRVRIDILQESIEAGVASGEMKQTIHDGGTEEGDKQCKHYFGDGIYARSMLIPAGVCVIGKIHKQARIVIIAQGKCRFVDEFQTRTVEAPWIGEFQAGSKTAVFAHTDTLWVACLGTDAQDSKTAFSDLVVATRAEYDAFEQMKEPAKCLSEQ